MISAIAIATAAMQFIFISSAAVYFLLYKQDYLSLKLITLLKTPGFDFYIAFILDKLSFVFLFVGSILTFLVSIYSKFYIHREEGFKRFFNNIQLFLKLQEENSHISVTACVTVGILNVMYLPEIIAHFNSIGLDYHTNMLHQPEYYNIRNIPESIKETIISKLEIAKSNFVNNLDKDRLDQICEILRKSSPNLSEWEKFVLNTSYKDRLRNESFSRTFPELHRLKG